MFTVEISGFTILCESRELPGIYSAYREHARFVDEVSLHDAAAGDQCFLGLVRSGESWPFLIVAQRYEPGLDSGFHPGALVVPETNRLFVGAGRRLLAYDLTTPHRLWEDAADLGFWRWGRHDDVVVMSAELELAAWDLEGRKLWSMFVEPPWDYRVDAGVLSLDVMGAKSTFPVRTGPGQRRKWFT